MTLGIIGFGAMGRAHAYAVEALPYFYPNLPFRARVGGICTTDPERSRRIAEEYGYERAYDDPMRMIADPHIDAISICTPNRLHAPLLRACIDAGKAVLCEKPLCTDADEAWEIARLAKEKGIVSQIVFQNRYLGAVLRAAEMIAQGRLGRILSFRFDYLHASCIDPDRRASWKQNADICGGGVLFDLGSHVLDLCTHLCGGVEAISGTSQIAFETRTGMHGEHWKTNADEAFYMTLRLKSGAVGTVTASKLATGCLDDMTFSIHGKLGALRFSLMEPHYLEFFDATLPISEQGYRRIGCGGLLPPPGGSFPSYKAASGWLRGHVGNMYAFMNAVHSGKQAKPSLASGAYVQTLMQAAMESSQRGSRLIPICLNEERKALCSFSV